MKKAGKSSPPIQRKNLEDYSETVIKLILQNLIEKFSLVKIISDVISITNIKEWQLKLKDTIPLDSRDIISIIYKNVGSVKLYKCLLELSLERKKNQKSEKKLNSPNKKKEIFLNFAAKKSLLHSPTISEENNKMNTSCDTSKNFRRKIKKDIIISISDDEENNNNNNIISLNENDNEAFSDEIKDDPLKKNKDRKKKKKMKKKILKKKRKINNSESKLVDAKKNSEGDYINKLGYHYTLEKGDFYKYKVKDIDKKKEIVKFICAEPKCAATGQFMVNNKMFKLLKAHSISSNEHKYNRDMEIKDINILNYMVDKNIEDIQLTKE